MKTLTALVLATSLLMIGCGSPQKTLEGTWSATLTPTVGSAQATNFNMAVLTNPDSSMYISNMYVTLSNGCVGSSADKSIAYDGTSKAMVMFLDDTNSSATLHGSLDADGTTVTGTYTMDGTSQSCQGGGMLTMTRIPNPGPNRGGR